MDPLIGRRELAVAAIMGALGDGGRAPIVGEVIGASAATGHLLRDGLPEVPAGEVETADVVVVGAGIAGLAAAWRLAALGIQARVVELEPFIGGTSTYGDAGAVAHPFGAHYLPVPNRGARAALRLLDEMGVLRGFDPMGVPRFDPKVLCHAPEERVFYRGAWFPGLVPAAALTAVELDEVERFSLRCDELARAVGRDGKKAFSIPIADSSRDPEYLALDALTARAFLDREGFVTPFLRWYVEYATRDDHGSDLDDVSAWAMLHYFTARDFKTEEMGGTHYLVWPEGNGRLVREMYQRSGALVRTGELCHGIARDGRGYVVRGLSIAARRSFSIAARGVVLALPAFVAARLLGDATGLPIRASSPWFVANLHVEGEPDPNLPWDSVLHESDGLGYVNAGHQLMVPQRQTVLTYFKAFGAPDVAGSRAALLRASWEDLARGVFADLHGPHPDLVHRTSRIDIARWGHAMPRPRPGFRGTLDAPVRLAPGLAYAHADVAGIALFEESQRAGVLAAEAVAGDLGARVGETWC